MPTPPAASTSLATLIYIPARPALYLYGLGLVLWQESHDDMYAAEREQTLRQTLEVRASAKRTVHKSDHSFFHGFDDHLVYLLLGQLAV